MCGGKGGTSNQSQSSSVSIPQDVLQNYRDVYAQAKDVSSQPFQSYSGQFVAPVNQTQQGGINTITGAGGWIPGTYGNAAGTLQGGVNASQPWFQGAGDLYGLGRGLAGASTGQVNPGALNTQQYMSPYTQNVVDATTQWLNQQNKQQQTDLKTNEIMQGAFGGDRGGIASGVLSGQQNMANASTISGLYNQNYAQALAAAQQQQGVGLQAGQANRAALLSGAGMMGQLGSAEQGLGQANFNNGLSAAGAYNQFGGDAFQRAMAQGTAQLGAGSVPQQTEQANLSAMYNQFLMQQAYPFQTTQFLSNIAGGLGPLQGSTTTQTGTGFQPQPFFSDDKLKEDVHEIGRTKNGLKIIRYRYKEDPHKLLRIGFLASDVEKKMPEAVQHHGGLRSVDYERAARASGGGIVTNDNAWQGYDDGGMVTPTEGRAWADDSGTFRDMDGNVITPRSEGPGGFGHWMPDDIQVGTGDLPLPDALTARPVYRGIQPTDHRNAVKLLSGPLPFARGGYAKGGGSMPGYDPSVLAAILAAQKAMYPGAAGRPGIVDSTGPHGIQLHPQAGREVMKAPLMDMRQSSQPQSEVGAALKTGSDLSKGAKDVGDLYSTGKDAIVGSAARGTPGQPGYVPASGGLVGTGGQWDWDKGWLGRNTSSGVVPANTNASGNTVNTGSGTVTSAPLPDVSSPPPFDGTDSGEWGRRHGGRLVRAAGGRGNAGFIPYAADYGYVPVEDYVPLSRTPIAELRSGVQRDGSGGGSGSNPGVINSLNSAVSLGKNAKSLWDMFGGMGGGEGADALPMSGLGSLTGDAASGAAGAAGSVGAGEGADALMGLFALKDGGRARRDTGGVVHSNDWMQYPGAIIGGLVGSYFGGPMGGMAGSKGGKSIGLGIGDAVGGNWEGVGDDFMDSLKEGLAPLKQMSGGGGGLPGMNLPGMGGGGGGGGGPLSMLGLRRGGRAGFEAGGSPETYGPSDDPDATNVVPLRPPPTAGLVVPQREVRNPERPAERERIAGLVPVEPQDPAAEVQADTRAEPPAAPPASAEELFRRATAAPSTATTPPPTGGGVVPPPAAAAPAPSVTTTPAPANDQFSRMLQQESSQRQFYPPGHEKAGQPVTSSKGAIGIAQVMPQTGPEAARLAGLPWNPELFHRGATGDPAKDTEAREYNLALGRAYYNEQLKKFGDPNIASAAYNAGPGAVEKALAQARATGQPYLNFLPRETQDYVRIVSGQGVPASLNAGLPGAAAGQILPQQQQQTAGVVPDRPPPDWWDRNEKYVIPALSFLGNMLSSPSRTLAGSIGSGLVGGAQSLVGQQGLQQGQQRLDITQRSQWMSQWAQMKQMINAAIASGATPDPQMVEQVRNLERLIGMTPGSTPTGAGNSPAGRPGSGVVPASVPPAGAPPALNAAPPAPIQTQPLPAPGTPPTPTPVQPGQPAEVPPSERLPTVDFPPGFKAQLNDDNNPDKLRERAKGVSDPTLSTNLRRQADEAQREIIKNKGGMGPNGFVPLPSAGAYEQSQARIGDNVTWATTQAPVFQQRQVMRNGIEHIAKAVEAFEPGALADYKAEAQALASALGVPPPNTATMNAAEFQTFVKNARNVVLGNATGDQKTDAARQILAEGFADPHLQPKAVRRILAQALGNLDAADDYYRDVTQTLPRVPHLDRTLRTDEFNKAHPIEGYYQKHEKDIAVRGDLPNKFSKDDIGRAYIMTPEEMLQRFPKNADVTLPQVRDKWFDGQNKPRRFRIGADGRPVPDGR